MESNKQARAEARLNTGLHNYWYPVSAAWAVTHAPIGITRL
ncbi:oxidoreductase, rieske (2fe-2S) region, partial [Cupriavidus basilensis OR16]